MLKNEESTKRDQRATHALGIVTLLDERYIHVWGTTTGWRELRYPKRAFPDHEVGTVVRYNQRKDFDEVEDSEDIYPVMQSPFHVIKIPNSPLQFKVQTLIVFPPEGCVPYSKVGIEDMQSITIVYSYDVGRVACFIPCEYPSDTVLSGYVCRIPQANQYLVPMIETLFCLTKDKLEEVTDPMKICEVFETLPWNMTSSESKNKSADGNFSKPTYKNSEERKSAGLPSYSKMDSNQLRREPIVQRTTTYDTLNIESELPPTYDPVGIIVRIEPNYSVIWSRSDGLICANVAPDSYELGKWVRYDCFDEENEPIECGNIRKSAFSLEVIADYGNPPRRCYKVDTTVQVVAYVKRSSYRNDNESFLSAHDDVLGTILCSKDKYLIPKLESGVEVFAIYMENYQRASHWIAFAMKNSIGSWTQLSNLPEPVRRLANKAFGEVDTADGEADTQQLDEYKESHYNTNPFKPPQDWKGVRNVSDRKVEDVLGIVVKHEHNEGQEVSVLYTVFGLARLPKRHAIGTWLRTTILEDQEEDKSNKELATTKNFSRCFIVLKSVVINPPMSTRVIKMNGQDRILLCGTIFKGGRYYENPYVGIVDDTHMKMPSRVQESKEYLIEMGLVRHRGQLIWQVIKSHGFACKDVNWVPLEKSCIPDNPGRLGECPKKSPLFEESIDCNTPGTAEIVTDVTQSPAIHTNSACEGQNDHNGLDDDFNFENHTIETTTPHIEYEWAEAGFADTLLGAHNRQGLVSQRLDPPRWNKQRTSLESAVTIQNGLTGFEDTIADGIRMNALRMDGDATSVRKPVVNVLDMNLEELTKGTMDGTSRRNGM